MKNKVLFVYSAYENIGIEYMSSILKKSGFETDLLFFPMLFEDSMLDISFLAKLFSYEDQIIEKCDMNDVLGICFNITTDHYRFFIRIAKKIKKRYPNIPIIFGGIHSSSAYKTVLKNSFVDYVAIGEGDLSIVPFMRYLQGRSSKIPYGFCYLKNNKIFNVTPGEFVYDLDKLPFPDKSIFYNKRKYLSTTYTIFTTRGCPYNCSYCINNFWYGKDMYCDNPRIRRRSVDNVIEELIEGLKKYNYSSVMFEDDVFILSEKWHWDFIKKYKKYINKPFVCVLHPKHCQNKKILKSLKEAGCVQIEIGIQTLNEKVRKKYLNRFETNNEIYKALKNLHETGLKFNIDHIAGLLEDNMKNHLKAVRLYSRYRPNRVLLFFITNYPSTDIEKINLENNKSTEKDIEKMHNGYGETDESTGSVSVEEAKELQNLRFLFGWLPYISEKMMIILLRTKVYRKIPQNRLFTKILPSIIATITGGEPRGEVILNKYLQEIFSFKWIKKFL